MTREQAIELLKRGPEGVTQWNAWRMVLQVNHGQATQLPDFTGADLTEAMLPGANLKWAIFINANLTGAKLPDANLTWAHFTGAILVGAKLGGANLTGATFARAILSGADLTKAYLNQAYLSGANLRGADLTKAYLSGADLSGADLRGADLSGADLTEADLRGADLRGAKLPDANLTGAKLGSCDGRFTDFSTVVYVRASWLLDLRMRLLTWQKVRSVGGLQVLTKASYLMLALVPVLAGVWLGVQKWLVAANLPTALPSAYAQGFFAALFVTLAHAVYQIRCPEMVATKSPDGFSQEVLAEFSTEAADCKDRLARALNALKELAVADPARRHPNLVRRHGSVVWVPSELRYFDAPPLSPAPTEDKPTDGKQPVTQSSPEELMRVAVEEGARAEYELLAIRDQPSATLAVVLYAAAGALIAWLVVSQAWKVARAAEWV